MGAGWFTGIPIYWAISSIFIPEGAYNQFYSPNNPRSSFTANHLGEHKPIQSMYGIFTYVHLVDFYGKLVGKYTSPMDAMRKSDKKNGDLGKLVADVQLHFVPRFWNVTHFLIG